MLVTVKDAKKRIEELQSQYKDFLKLQNYAMGLDLPELAKRTSTEKAIGTEREATLQKIREEANLILNIRTLGTIGCDLCDTEITRIESIIDSTKVNI